METGVGRQRGPDVSVAEILYRIGIVHDFEIRVGTGVLRLNEPREVTGRGPLDLGFKYNIKTGGANTLQPGIGFEFQLQIPLAAAELDDGKVLPSASFNFDHSLPADFSIGWSAGFNTSVDVDGDLFLQSQLQWSLDYQIDDDLSVYVTGDTTYPATSSGDNTNHGGWCRPGVVVKQSNRFQRAVCLRTYRRIVGQHGAVSPYFRFLIKAEKSFSHSLADS